MPKYRYRTFLEITLLVLSALCLLVAAITLGFTQTVSKEHRALIVLITSMGVMVCFVGLISTRTFWKWLRTKIWRRAISTWKANSQAGFAPKFDLASQLPEAGLQQLAVRVYSKMGYIILNGDREDEYIRLANPEGGIELVACPQQPNPVEILRIHNLYREIKKVGAVRGFLWSAAGFTGEAVYWARQKPIILADPNEIGRLVDCADEKGSILLEH